RESLMASSVNLVSLITRFITPEMITRASTALGLDRNVIEKAMSAGIPGILASLVSLVSKPGGAARIENAIEQHDPGLLANIGNVIGTPEQRSVVDNGMSSLSSLLGSSATSTLSN